MENNENTQVFNSCCNNCQRFCGKFNNNRDASPCVIDHMTMLPLCYPQENKKECEYIVEKIRLKPDVNQYLEENKSELSFIEKNKDNIDKMEKFEPHVEEFPQINIVNHNTGLTLSDEEYNIWKEKLPLTIERSYKNFRDNLYNKVGLKITSDGKVVDKDIETPEDMLLGDLKIDHLTCATSWKRALNAARRTIGKEPVDHEPSKSWEAKMLLAEHSPIRLVEYDFGWKKIRQWVTTHLVRHHEGCEKFVHSQRGDRRELPCDRDHIFQGAKNDMDMTVNAQAMMSISRKRLCKCASKETREAWSEVIDELDKVDSVLAHKCVPECVYRGFCPEFMNSCGYWKTDEFKKHLADYRRTKYGKDRKFYCINEGNGGIQVIVENTGHIYKIENDNFGHPFSTGEIPYEVIKDYQLTELKYEKHDWYNGPQICITNPIIPVCSLVYSCFGNDLFYMIGRQQGRLDIMPKGEQLTHYDGNIYNNDIDNIKNLNPTKNYSNGCG